MRKLISVFLSALMLLSLCAIGISAAPKADEVGKVSAGYTPEGTAISSIAEATDPAGKYYLTADVTLPATLPVTFTGTLDGNGHTITVSAPMFQEFNGTLKNVTIAGSVDVTGGTAPVHTGTVAGSSSAAATFDNVKNTATVKGWVLDNKSGKLGELKSRIGTGSLLGYTNANVTVKNCANVADINGYAVGGFVGYVEGADAAVHFENCLNSGKVTDAGAVKDGNNGALGGMVGICNNTKETKFIGCTNSGEILGTNGGAESNNCPAGGLVGYIYYGKGKTDGTCLIKDCLNTANVTGSNQVGGIGGSIYTVLTAENVVNKGNITSTHNYAAGLVGRNGNDRDDDYKDTAFVVATFKNCQNYGNVKSAEQYAGGISGYISWGVVAENCVNYGSLDATAAENLGHVGGIIALSQTSATVKNSYNYGKVESSKVAKVSAGGIMGRAANKGGPVNFERCGNFGEIIGHGSGANYGSGGISGYAWGGNGTTVLRYCFNAGKVTATTKDNSAAGLVTYLNTKSDYTVEYCFNSGDVTIAEGSTGYCADLYYNKSVVEIKTENIHDNFYLEGKVGIINGAGEELAEVKVEKAAAPVSAADMASGKLCYDLNTLIKAADASVTADVFYQVLGTDKGPSTVFSAKGVVEKNADGSYQNSKEPVEDPNPTPAPTGDPVLAVVAVMGVALVAVLGTAYASKKARD